MISVFGSKVGDEEIEAVSKVMRSQWMGFGKIVSEFEEQFAKRQGLINFIMVDSGSNALFAAVTLLDLPKSSEIILPSLTWVSCAQAILLAGHIPVFCDVELDTFNVSRRTIEPHINKNTKAIMVVHFAGKPVDLNPIIELGFPIIEDAAHAVDSSYYGKPCGGITDVGIYSFDAVKNLTAGEGGGLATSNVNMIERARKLRYCGIGKSGFEAAASNIQNNRWWEYNISEYFIKMLPTNIAAAIALEQLKKLETLQHTRQRIWNIYQKEFKGLEWLIRPCEAEVYEKHSYFTYAIRVPKRNQLAKYLLDKGIYTTLRYHPLHMNPIYKSDAKLMNTEMLNNDALSIPLHPNLKDEDVQYIIEAIKSFGV